MDTDEIERRKKRIAIEEKAVRDLEDHMYKEDARLAKESRWRVGKEIPIATIIVLLIQTAGVVWWAATISTEIRYEKDARLTFTTMQIATDRRQDEEKTNSEARIAGRLDKIDAKLDRVAEKVMK